MVDFNEIIIRLFTSEDADLIFDFFKGLSNKTRYLFHPYSFTREEAEKLAGEDVDNPDTQRYMAILNKNGQEIMIGHVFFWDWARKVPWLGIAVRDEYQGIGLGKKLMEHAINEALKNNKGGILLTTMKDNHTAQSLYKRYGFEIIGENNDKEYLLILNFKVEI